MHQAQTITPARPAAARWSAVVSAFVAMAIIFSMGCSDSGSTDERADADREDREEREDREAQDAGSRGDSGVHQQDPAQQGGLAGVFRALVTDDQPEEIVAVPDVVRNEERLDRRLAQASPDRPEPPKITEANPLASPTAVAALTVPPGAPQVVQEVEEQEQDAPPTNANDAPVVTDPNPTLTPSLTPATDFGFNFSGGGGGVPFSNSNGQGEFGAEFIGVGGVARDIAFVVDASGSMLAYLPDVVNELEQAIERLVPDQNITVIFFSGEGVFEMPAAGGVMGLRSVTPAFKQAARDWIQPQNGHYAVGGSGQAFAEEAIIRALSYEPQLVLLLSDDLTGGGQGLTQHEINQDNVIELIMDVNDHTPPTQINTIQFVRTDPLESAGLTGTMQRIAEQTGGRHRFISEAELR